MTITSEAMIVNWTIIRMLVGIELRSRLTKRFDSVSTQITAMLITSEVSMRVVTASAEQMPSTCRAIGFSLNRGSTSGSTVPLTTSSSMSPSL